MKGALSITALAIIAKINATQLKNSEEITHRKLQNHDYLGVRFIDEIDFDMDNVESRVQVQSKVEQQQEKGGKKQKVSKSSKKSAKKSSKQNKSAKKAKSQKKSSSVKKAKSTGKSQKKSRSAKKSRSSRKSKSAKKTRSSKKSRSAKKSRSSRKTKSAKKTRSSRKSRSAKKSRSSRKSAKKLRSSKKSRSSRKSRSSKKSRSSRKSRQSKKSKSSKKTRSSRKSRSSNKRSSKTPEKNKSKNVLQKTTEEKSASTTIKLPAPVYPRGLNLYPDTRPGHEWWELDDPNERIHGTHNSDEYHPYDPVGVDAPEDIPRITNTNKHEPLHNAVLSPDGYYKGWFHKDYKGFYSQLNANTDRYMRNLYDLQVRDDHRRDTDDLVEDTAFIMDHDNDTEDIPDGLEPLSMLWISKE